MFREVLDASQLRNVKKLILSQASKIKDFGMLGEVQNLTITNANKSCLNSVGNYTHSRFKSISLVKCEVDLGIILLVRLPFDHTLFD